MEHSNQEAFQSAGYTEMSTNEEYVGGLVRQRDNLSFTRVFQAGHSGMFAQQSFPRIFG